MNKLKLVALGLATGLAVFSSGAFAAGEVTVTVVAASATTAVAAGAVAAPSLPTPRRRPSVLPPSRR